MASSVTSKTRWRRWRRPAARARPPAARPGRRPARHRRALASTRARALASSSRARSSALSWSRTSTSSRSRARGSLAIGPSASSALVFCEISRAAASRWYAQRRGRLLADEALELGVLDVDLRRRGPPRGRAGPRPRRGPPARAPRAALDASASPSTSSASMSDRPRRRRSISTSRSWACCVHAAAQPQRDGREDEADDRDDRADGLDGDAQLGDRRGTRATTGPAGQQDPDHDQREGHSATAAARSAPGARSNVTSTSPARAAFSSRIRPSSVRRRSTPVLRTGSGFGDGWLPARTASSAATSTAWR